MGKTDLLSGGMTAEKVTRIREVLDAADLVIVTASNGLDMSEGLNIFRPDQHFIETYGDLATATGAMSILQGMASPGIAPEQRWAWFARFAQVEWLSYEPTPLMRTVRELVGEKDHMVVTCNIDGRLAKVFDEQRIVETEGSVRQLTCSAHCCDERLDATEAMRAANARIEDGRVPTELIPRCPHCGAMLTPATDEMLLAHPDGELRERLALLNQKIERAHGKNIVVLELGIGARNQAIKVPTMDLVATEERATYITFNYNEVFIPKTIADRSIGISGDLGHALAQQRRHPDDGKRRGRRPLHHG